MNKDIFGNDYPELPEPKIYQDIHEMIKDMKNHYQEHKAHIIIADEPRNLRIGYICEETGQIWEINVATMNKTKRSLNIQIDRLNNIDSILDEVKQ